jgi:hypothetical protein
MMHSAARASSSAFVISPRYTGKERDVESGNDYMFARGGAGPLTVFL